MRTSGCRGFTLIELMVAVAIIGILVAVAFPSYQDHVRKGKRAEGKAALLKAAQLEERYFTENNHYADNTPQAGRPTFQSLFGAACAYPVGSAENCMDGGNYRVEVELTAVGGTNDMAFTLTARPFPATPTTDGWDPDCGFLRITNTGVRTWEKQPNNAARCRW